MRLNNREVLTDPNLLQRARQFDTKALAEIYDEISPGLYAYAYRQLGSDVLAEECVSETFMKLLEAFSKQKGPREQLRAYIYCIAHNWITDQYRRSKLTIVSLEDQALADPVQSTTQTAADNMERDLLRDALQQLTPPQRQVIVLKFLEGWSGPEIAQALKKPLEAIKGLQHRALETLRLSLAGEYFTDKD